MLVEAASIGGDIVLLRGVFATPGSRIGWKASYQITLAGAAADEAVRHGWRRRRRADGLGAAGVGTERGQGGDRSGVL